MCNALKRAAVFVGFSKSDFNDNQCFLIKHDQIEFALFAAEITANRFETFSKQKIMSLFFGIFAAGQVGRFRFEFSQHIQLSVALPVLAGLHA